MRLLSDLIEMNPCGMRDESFHALSGALSVMISKEYRTEMTLEQVSLWLGVSIRTIGRWQKTRGFPEGKIKGKTALSFSVTEITEWINKNKN